MSCSKIYKIILWVILGFFSTIIAIYSKEYVLAAIDAIFYVLAIWITSKVKDLLPTDNITKVSRSQKRIQRVYATIRAENQEASEKTIEYLARKTILNLKLQRGGVFFLTGGPLGFSVAALYQKLLDENLANEQSWLMIFLNLVFLCGIFFELLGVIMVVRAFNEPQTPSHAIDNDEADKEEKRNLF